MPALSSIPRPFRVIGADRQSVERDGVRLAAAYGRRAFLNAAHAVRLGHDPAKASADVLMGNAAIGQPGLPSLLARTMLLAHLKGMRRTQLNATARGIGTTLNLSTPLEIAAKQKAETERLVWLLLLDDDEDPAAAIARAQTIERHYLPVATRMIQSTARPLLGRMAESASHLAGRPAAHVPVMDYLPPRKLGSDEAIEEARRMVNDRLRRIGEDFSAEGFLPKYDYALRRTVETATVQAYEAGRRDGYKAPPVIDALWGFRYSAILDNRTTRLCRTLDGMIAPKDDTVWETFTPPNHFNCRSCVVEVWKSSALATPSVIQPTATPDDIEAFRRIKRDFESYQ